MRLRATLTAVYEYDANPMDYDIEEDPEGMSTQEEQMIEWDEENFTSDPGLLVDYSETKITVKVEKVDG